MEKNEVHLTLSEPGHAAMPETSPASSNMSPYLSLWLELVFCPCNQKSPDLCSKDRTMDILTCWVLLTQGCDHAICQGIFFFQSQKASRIHGNFCLTLSEGERVLGQLL